MVVFVGLGLGRETPGPEVPRFRFLARWGLDPKVEKPIVWDMSGNGAKDGEGESWGWDVESDGGGDGDIGLF